VPWPDSVIDTLGHDPRSAYVERFWLPILGPSTTFLLRRIAAGLEISPDGFDLDFAETARSLGLGARGGKHSPFQRAISRCVTFDAARRHPSGALAVRRHLPPLPQRHLIRLPDTLQEEHRAWRNEHPALAVPGAVRQRCQQLALSLLHMGEDAESVERQLVRWRFSPALAHEATCWAVQRATQS
jgi:hypothetical protein